MLKMVLHTYIVLSLTFFVLIFFFIYLLSPGFQDVWHNSDMLFIYQLTEDVLFKGGKFFDWTIAAAPYFFPEYLFAALSHLLTSNLYYKPIITTYCLLLLNILCTFYLCKQVLLKNIYVATCLIVCTENFLCLFFKEPIVLFFIGQGIHTSSFVFSLLLIGLCFRFMDLNLKKRKYIYVFMSYILTVLCVVSDAIFIVQAIIPLVATYTVYYIKILCANKRTPFQREIRRQRLIIFVLSLLSIGSYYAGTLIPNAPKGFIKIQPISYFADNFYSFINIYINYFHTDVIFSIFISLIQVSYIFIVFISAFRKQLFSDRFLFLILFSIISIMSTLFSSLILGLHTTLRYMLPIHAWPIIISFIGLILILKQKSIIFYIIFTCVMVSISLHLYIKYMKFNTISFKKMDSSIECIDRLSKIYGFENGITQYWEARPVEMFSKSSLKMSTYQPNLEFQNWTTSSRKMKASYDFAIINQARNSEIEQLSFDMIQRLNGKPEHVEMCGSRLIIIYKKNKLRTKKFVNNGDCFTWYASEILYTKEAQLINNKIENIIKNNSNGITYGPYERLPEGEYRFDLEYESDFINDSGYWDVVANADIILKKGKIAKENATTLFSESFTIDSSTANKTIEIRTYSNGKSELKIVSLKLTKIK